MADDRHFQAALDVVLKHEGGYVNDPKDAGGETKFGISKRAHPGVDIKNLTRDGAAKIYKAQYWDAGKFGLLDNREIAIRAFDLAVNCGTGTAVKLLQRAYNLLQGQSLFSLEVDGRLGAKTAAAINGFAHPRALLMALKHLAAARYVSLKQPRFLTGWFNRLED